MPKKTTVKGLNSYPKLNAKKEIVKDKKGKPILCWKYRFTDRATGGTSRQDDRETIRLLVEKYGLEGVQDLIAETTTK